MSGTNAWLVRQRKSDLVDLAELVGLKGYEGQKKADLEVTLDDYLANNTDQFASEPKLVPYYNSRAKAAGSPTKKDPAPKDDGLKLVKRRTTRAASEIPQADSSDQDESTATALVARTPARNLSLASRIPLPATPAEVAEVVDRSTQIVRTRVSSMYQESGITEGAHAVQETLSTVTAIILSITLYEVYALRPEVLPGRYAFTIPTVPVLNTSPQPVYVPDMFLVLTSSFWSPVLTWTATSIVIPAIFGYFYNLSAASHAPRRGRPSQRDYNIDPVTFSIIKALVSFLVLGQQVTLLGYPGTDAVARINSAIYGGWKGVITGAAISGLVSMYDAVLRK